MIKDGLAFITEDLIIENCKIYDYGKRLENEEVKVLIDAKMKEYIIKKSDNSIIRGDKDNYHSKRISLTFIKQNNNKLEGLIHNCPNCGAEVSQTEFGKCPYCHTLLFPIRYNWTLTKFETM